MSIINQIYLHEVEERYRIFPDTYTCNVNHEDYTSFEAKKPLLASIMEFDNSTNAIYDLHQKVYLSRRTDFYRNSESIFYSEVNNRKEPLWFLPFLTRQVRHFVYDSIVSVFDFLNQQKCSERKNYKLILDLVLAHPNGCYCRILLQIMPIELDRDGKLWLMLGNVHITLLKEAACWPPQHQLMHVTTKKERFFEHSASCQPLSPCEIEVIKLVSQGFESKEIAGFLHVSRFTVDNHRHNILGKTFCDNMTQAVLYAKRIGVV